MKSEFEPTLPKWVSWIAQDGDGVWWAYEVEPNEAAHGWYENEVGRSLRLSVSAPNPDWRNSLHKIERRP